MVEKTCDWCGDRMDTNDLEVVITLPESAERTLDLCASCVERLENFLDEMGGAR